MWRSSNCVKILFPLKDIALIGLHRRNRLNSKKKRKKKELIKYPNPKLILSLWNTNVFWQLVRQLIYTLFITNNHASLHLCWKENFVKYQKVSKYCAHDCLQNFLLLFMFLLIASIIKNSHFLAGIYFLFLKNILDQT